MRKRILSLLLCIVMCLSLMPMMAFAADTEITSVSITGIKTPVAGQTVAENISSVSVNSDANYAVHRVIWWRRTDSGGLATLSDSETFNSTSSYFYQIYLEPKAGYSFPFGNQISGPLYEYNGTVSTDELDCAAPQVHLEEGYRFDRNLVVNAEREIQALSPISDVSLTVTPPVAGATPATTFTATNNTNDIALSQKTILWREYDSNSSSWVNMTTSTFVAGTTYQVMMVVYPEVLYFAGGGGSSTVRYTGVYTVNGNTPSAADRNLTLAYGGGPGGSYSRCLSARYAFPPVQEITYDVWVNGEQFNENKLTITCGTGTATLDPTTTPYTLTLDGAEITNTYCESRDSSDCLIYTPYDINVVVKDDSKLYNPDSSKHTPGILTHGSLTLTGSADLDISGYIDSGLWSSDNLTIDMEGDISIVSDGEYSGGIAGVKGLLVSGSGDLTIDVAVRPGISVPQGTATLDKTGDIKVTSGGIGIQADHDVVISGSGDVTICGSRRNAIRVNRSNWPVDIYSVLLNGTNGVITLKTDAGNVAVWDEYNESSPVAGTNLANYAVTGAPDTNSVVYTYVQPYDVWVNGEQFTENKLTIACGTGTATYDPATRTVTLNNAVITKMYDYEKAYIYADGDLTVNVIGDSTIADPLNQASAYEFQGIRTTGDFTLTGSGNFDILLGNPSKAGQAGYIYGDLLIDMDGDLTVEGFHAFGSHSNTTIAGSGDVSVKTRNIAFDTIYGSFTLANKGKVTVVSDSTGIMSALDTVISGSGPVYIKAYGTPVDLGGIRFLTGIDGSGSKLLLNGIGSPIELYSEAHFQVVYNSATRESPVAGTHFGCYIATGDPSEKEVTYTFKTPAEGPTVRKDPNSPTGYTVEFVYKNDTARSVIFAGDVGLRNDADITDLKQYVVIVISQQDTRYTGLLDR